MSPRLRVDPVPCAPSSPPPWAPSTPFGFRMKLVTRAHAKGNLALRVLGTRADGFHELRTVFQTIELHDTLTLEVHDGAFAVKCRMPGVPLDNSNLVWRAASALWAALGRAGEPADVVITIDKAIPMQAGLGC